MSISSTETLYVDTPSGLQDLCARLEGCDVVALDTEFIRERSYQPKLELVQLATRDLLAIIDYGALGYRSIDPFAKLLSDPAVLKVFHAADQDLEVLAPIAGVLPGPIFDTQIAGGLVSPKARLGYGALVESLLGVKLAKGEGMTDWSIRPLSPSQLSYAIDDVRYLLPMYDKLAADLEALGRMDWASEEFEALRRGVQANRELSANPRTAYLRVRGRHDLGPLSLAVLRELAAWREEEALRRDRPRGSVLKDEILVELARRKPNQPQQLNSLRGMPPRELEKSAQAIVARIAAAKALPSSEYPRPEETPGPPSEAAQALASLMQATVQAIAAQHRIAPSILATTADLQRMADAFLSGSGQEGNVISGWRMEVVGETLLALMRGEIALAWDNAAKTLRPLATR